MKYEEKDKPFWLMEYLIWASGDRRCCNKRNKTAIKVNPWLQKSEWLNIWDRNAQNELNRSKLQSGRTFFNNIRSHFTAVRAHFTCVLSRTAGTEKALLHKTYLRQQSCNSRVTFTTFTAPRRVRCWCLFAEVFVFNYTFSLQVSELISFPTPPRPQHALRGPQRVQPDRIRRRLPKLDVLRL